MVNTDKHGIRKYEGKYRIMCMSTHLHVSPGLPTKEKAQAFLDSFGNRSDLEVHFIDNEYITWYNNYWNNIEAEVIERNADTTETEN